MANVKISNLPTESDVNNIIGFAGYNAAGTCKISGADLINTLPSSTPTLEDVLTAGDEAIDQRILFKPTTDLRVFKVDKGGLQMSNDNVDLGIIHTGFGRIFIATVDEPIVLQSIGTGSVVFNTPEIKLQSCDVLDSTSSAGSAGEVLSSLGTGNGTEWITAGGSTPNLASVLSTGSVATSGQTITLGDTGPGGPYTAVMGAGGVTINNSGPFDITSNGEIKMSYTGGGGGDQITISTLGGLGTGAGILIDAGGQSGTGLRLKSGTEINVAGTGLGTPAVGDVLSAKNVSGDVEWTTPATPANSLTVSNTVDTDMFNDGVVRLWWDVSASDIELEITNQGGGSGSTSSVYHASYTNFDGTSTSTTTTDFNAQNATTTGTLDFNFATDEVMILRLWTPDTSLQPGFGYYEVTFTKSSSLYTGTPILCSVRKSSL
jgi:hypothetical protein